MTQPDRDPGRDADPGRSPADASTGSDTGHDGGTRDGDDQQLAAILRDLTKAHDIIREALILLGQPGCVVSPVVPVDAKQIDLLPEDDNAKAVQAFARSLAFKAMLALLDAVYDKQRIPASRPAGEGIESRLPDGG
jgi:hypothetical protein